MIMNRKEFRRYWKEKTQSRYIDDILFCPESASGNRKSRYFVCIRPVKDDILDEYRLWCYQNCVGQILCYSSSETEEWWGFTHKPDIIWWRLRWA